MICKSNTYAGLATPNRSWPNWSQRVTFHADQYYEPQGGAAGLSHLVNVIAAATAGPRGVHAIGSGWAFEDVAQSDSWTVCLSNFTRLLTYVTGAGGPGLTDAWRAKQADPNAATRLVHAEAGMEIGALSEALDAIGLAVPTLGGANGQSLAGAISTSTHGGDWDQPPLPDFVRAIHLVTHGGEEIWIERESEPITTDARLAPVLPCGGAQIIRSDEVFNAALVSFGRFGVIYSFVLEVRRAFRVVEVATRPARAAVLQALRAGTGTANLFDPLFALLAQTPPPTSLAERAAIAAAANRPYFWQLVFNSLDPNDLWVQRRWITTQPADLNIAAVNPTPGCILTPALNIVFTLGTAPVAPIMGHALSTALSPAMNQGARGPHYLLTSGVRAASHSTARRADSIEVIFSAHDSAYIDFLDAIQPAGQSLRQAGYVSVRPSRTSRGTLSMHNVPGVHAVSIEVATLKGLPDNQAWMDLVHREAVNRGGRPHWGQINTLDEAQMNVLYGRQATNWRNALQQVSGASRLFSNNFSRRRALEPLDYTRQVTAVSPAVDQLVVMGIAPGRFSAAVQSAQWSPTSPWAGWQARSPGVGSQNSFFGSAAVDGKAYMFRIGPDGWVYFISRAPNGQWSIWWIVGASNDPGLHGVSGGAVHAVSCQPGMLHVLYTDRLGRVVVSRGDTTAGTTWPDTRRIFAGRTSPGGHVTAVSRRPGQIDIFMVGTDGVVYTAPWNAGGWKQWAPIHGMHARPGTCVSAVSRRLDHIDLFAAAADGRTVSAAWDPQSGWKGWWHIQGGTTNSGYVSAVSRSADKLDIFTVAPDHSVVTAAWDPAHGWGGWWPVTSAKAQSIVWPVSRAPDKLDLFFVTPAGTVQTAAWAPGHPWGGPWGI